ncbi:hypothetical protein [Providencia stuartii]|uniref:hypothetical protein n=1 Tax=Providencia stuartii TaxID=588 RepID=UPI0029DE40C5|nr:hypothetical protein [Providencia stuartii]MDX7494397.1 hypothetical protein [Providencia stuartii]
MSHHTIRENVIQDILLWIDMNVDKPLNIAEISHRAGYSKWYFQKYRGRQLRAISFN